MKSINEIKSRILTVSGGLSYRRYSNGYIVEFSGEDSRENYINVEFICWDFDELISVIKFWKQRKLNR